MQTPPSTAFIDALRWGTYLVAAQLTVYDAGGNSTSVVVPCSEASFTVDRNSEFRRQGSISVEILPTIPPQQVTVGDMSYTYLPLTPQSLLAPFGNEISVAMSVVQNGVAGANGWVPLGRFQIATSTIDDTGVDMTTNLDLYDRSWAIAQRELLTAYNLPAAGGDLQSEVEALIATAWTGSKTGKVPWTYSITPSTSGYTVPAGTLNQGQDPWQACLDLAASCNYELFFDVNGNVVGKPVPDPGSQPVVWNFTGNALSVTGQPYNPVGGTPYTTPIDVTLAMTRDGVSNDFFVSATGSNNTPVQEQVYDNNPASPTYVNGPMGNIPTFIYDANITTGAEATGEATYDLQSSLGQVWTLAVDTPPNPLFDIDDVCTMTWPRLGLNLQKFVVDTISVDVRYDVATNVMGRVVTPWIFG